ncbi:Gfo/Idh/MocA family protein [Deinococcus yavapaiensis]|uniref:Putative dehydrogenase n=1 Tax=Deinococcus yavapaiensis KR-236 TaxID=694435 RepID=A0A318S969_9DEIO|nr:Gfo/Idh/MocA family oxidoreductase [Deinococcus yavapaiensis]PYE52747.1 putative dehydrogenase [Deinococcus yavapaiensis KR-236]
MSHAPSPSPVRVGILGVGAIGLSLARSFAAHPETVVTALHDRDASRADAAVRETGGRWFDDPRALLDAVDLVYVAVPPAAHHDLVLSALRAGRHVLCEKPLAVNLAEATEMLEAARAAGVVHAMQLPLPYQAGVRVFAEQVRSGTLGDLRHAEVTMVFPEWPRAWQRNPWIATRAQGGPVRECTPHLFQVVEDVLGPVTRLRADVTFPSDPEHCEQSAVGVLELASGVRVAVNVLTDVRRPEDVSLTVYGSAGTARLGHWRTPMFAADDGPLQPLPVSEDGGVNLVSELVKAVRGEAAFLLDFSVGARLQQLQDAWEASAERGARIETPYATAPSSIH